MRDVDTRGRSRAELLELLAMLVGPLPGNAVPQVLRDPAPDPGLFGPRSVTWRIAREPLLLLGGGRALLMQVAHPLVGQGVADHSDYEQRPFGRLLGTVYWLVRVIFGTTAEAEAASRRVAGVHAHVRGALDAANATPRIRPSAPYDASDPALALWVHATIVESMLVAHETFIGRLPDAARDRFVREWASVGALMGVERASLWQTADELGAYVAQQIASGAVLPVPASFRVAPAVLQPPLPWRGLGLPVALMAFLTTGLLPEPLRRGYRLRWTPIHQCTFVALCALLRAAHPWLPRRLRVTPLYDIAVARMCRPAPGPRP